MNRRVALVFIGVCASGVLAAQTPQRQPPSGPTFRVQVDAVEVDAFVTDAQGNPVTDLRADDFEVLEDGKPQTITSFSLVNIPIERPERLPGGPPIEPDVKTNDEPEGRLYVIAFDEVSAEGALRSRHFLRRFIEQQFGANDVAAVAFLGRAPQRNAQDFTGNARLLLASIDSFSGGFPRDDPGSSPLQEQLGAAAPPPKVNVERLNEVRRVARNLRTLTEFMAKVRGRRKALLLFAEGLAVDIFKAVDYRGGVLPIAEEDVHAAVTAATRGGVTIYSIDPRGLTPEGDLPGTGSPTADDSLAASIDPRQSLRFLSRVTGGFAVTNSNSFEAAFTRIVRENSTYYVLGFSSTNERRDGRYRKLDVRVKRPGLQIRSRDGYLAPLRAERVERPTTSAVSAAVAGAIGSPIAVTGLPIRVFAAPYRSAKKEARVAIAVEVDASRLGLVERDGAYVGQLEMTYVATDTENKIYRGPRHAVTLTLTPQTYEASLRQGIRVLAETSLRPGRYQLRVAAGNVADVAGSVVYDLEVPDYTKAPLTMSGVSLASRVASQTRTVSNKDPLDGALPGPITATRTFTSDDTLALFAEVYENVSASTAHTIDLSAELRDRTGRVVRSVSDKRSSSELQGRSGGYGFTPTLPLEGLTAGVYVIHVEARSAADARATVSRDIRIEVR